MEQVGGSPSGKPKVYVPPAGHTSGALYLESNYYDLRAGYIYGQSFFDENPSYAIYVTQILDAGAVSSTPEEIVTLEIYYE